MHACMIVSFGTIESVLLSRCYFKVSDLEVPLYNYVKQTHAISHTDLGKCWLFLQAWRPRKERFCVGHYFADPLYLNVHVSRCIIMRHIYVHSNYYCRPLGATSLVIYSDHSHSCYNQQTTGQHHLTVIHTIIELQRKFQLAACNYVSRIAMFLQIQ